MINLIKRLLARVTKNKIKGKINSHKWSISGTKEELSLWTMSALKGTIWNKYSKHNAYKQLK
jgi:hypothetical protein